MNRITRLPVRAGARMLDRALLVSVGLVAPLLLLAGAARAECSPTDRNNAEQSYTTAYQFVTANQWAEAIPSLKAAIAACSEHWPSVELMAQAMMRTKKYGEAVDYYQRLIQGNYGGDLKLIEERILLPYGYNLLQTRRFKKSEAVYEAVLEKDPVNKEAHQRLVYAYDKSGQIDRAIEHLKVLYGMTEGKEHSTYANKIGEAYKKIGDTATAAEWFSQSGEASGGLFTIATEHMKAKRYQQAADAFKAYLDKKPNSAPGWKNYGQCLQQLGRRQEAIAAFQKALEVDPARHDVVRSLGFLYLDLERWSDAGRLAQDALANWPESDKYKQSIYFLMGKVLEQRDNDYEGAIKMFEHAKSDPYWGSRAEKEIVRQNQLIEIRQARRGQGR